MPRYIYDHCEIGSRHDGGLGSHDSLDEAMRRAAQGVGRHGPDVYASVYDTVTGRHLEVRRRAIDGDPVLTPRRCLTLLREQAATDGWSLPAHRPRRDPAAARVNLVCRVHPTTRARLDAARAKTGEGLGELIDQLALTLTEEYRDACRTDAIGICRKCGEIQRWVDTERINGQTEACRACGHHRGEAP
jgi:hypothetical protein